MANSEPDFDTREVQFYGWERKTDLRRLCRQVLTPEPEVAGLIQSLDIGSRVRCQLRPFLEADPAPPHQQKAVREEEGREEGELREAERWLMGTQARVLKGRTFGGRPVIPRRQRGLLPVWRVTRGLVEQRAVETGLLLGGDGKFVLAEYPDPGPCEHLHPLLEPLKPARRQPETSSPRAWAVTERRARFAVQPTEVYFRELTIGRTYVARLVVRNAGDHSASFSLQGPSTREVFSLSARDYRGQVLAPGLAVALDLRFICRDKLDRADSLRLLAGGQRLVVRIWAVQAPPVLVSVSCPLRLKLFGEQPEGEDGSLVEFDQCFVGDRKTLALRLENQGPAARFFIVSEAAWTEQSIEGVRRTDYTVASEPFAVRPAHFALETGAAVELELGFAPTCAGSHVARLYVLCDNATLRPLDLLGEALTFSRDIIRFQNFEKRYNIFIEDVITAQYYFYIGEFYANTKAERTFEVKNTSPVEMEYSWEGPAEGLLAVRPAGGLLAPDSEQLFSAAADTARLSPGRHRAVFTLSVNEIPVKAFPEKYREEITTNGTEKGSIVVAVIEIWVDVVMPPIFLKENYIHLTTNPDRLVSRHMYVMNESRVPVRVGWELGEAPGSKLSIWPLTATIPPVATSRFTLRFSSPAPGLYTGLLRAGVREPGELWLEAAWEAEVRAGLEGGSVVEDLGIREAGRPFEGTLLLPPHLGAEKNVELKEFTLKVHGDGRSWLARTKGAAEYNTLRPTLPRVDVKISNGVEEVGLLLLDLDYSRGHFFVLILSDFQELDVSLAQAKYVFTKTLYVGKEETVGLRLVNHKLVACRFSVGERFGPDSGAVEVCCCPAQGTIPPGEHFAVAVTLRPRRAGLISDVFIPCQVDGQKEPLIAQVVGMIKDKEVKISWPTEDQAMIACWPEEECDQENPKQNSTQISKKVTEITTSSVVEEGSYEVEGEWEEEEGSGKTGVSAPGSVPYEKWPVIGGRYYGAEFRDKALERDFNTPWTCESLNRRMKTLPVQEREEAISFFSKRALCFDMKLFEESTMQVEIFNVAPTPCSYKARVKFFKTVKNPEKLNPIMVAEMQVYGRKRLDVECPALVRRRWERLIPPELGLGVRVAGGEGSLAGREAAALRVTAFALAWGLYLDTLLVEIPGLPVFHLPLLFKVRDSPAFFTYNMATATPTLRFRSVLPNSLRRQTVYLRNRCPLPLKVVWSVFGEAEGGHFSAQLELHPEEPRDFCRLHLTDHFGRLGSPYFSVEPRVSLVEPLGKTPVHILLDTALAKADPLQLVKYLRATLLGTLYVQQEAREKRLNEEHLACYRPDGFNIKQVQLKLETKIEVPTIRLINPSKANALFEVKTRDIFCSGTESYSEKRKFTLHNCANRKVFLKLLSSHPFTVTRVVTHKGEMPVSEEVIVDKQDVFEVEVTLQLTAASIQEECDGYYTYLSYPDTIRRELVCRERNYSENVYPLFLQILKPQLNISVNPVNFGCVLLEDVRTQNVAVTSKYGDEPYLITFKNKENVFYVSPQNGIIRPGFKTHLTVKFKPKQCRKYCAKVQLVTTTPGQEAILTIFGEGVDHIRDEGSEEGHEGYDFFTSYCDSEAQSPTISAI